MRCLEAGGMDAVYDKLSDVMNYSAPPDYVPNPNGFYQFNGEVDNSFPTLYDNKLIKFPIKKLNSLPEASYKVILLKRDPREIRASMSKWTPYSSWGTQEVVTFLYEEFMQGVREKLSTYLGIEILEINYKDIVNNPVETFTTIKNSGWEINVQACVDKVDSSLYRNNLEKDI